MPHVTIKHFAGLLDEQHKDGLVQEVAEAIQRAFGCDDGVISVAVEPVPQEVWRERVYLPEIAHGGRALAKKPNY
ncbi:tautomerase family protein [Haloechinothrix halophila]|uniref:tautomerase family protein n=1 Tax=Haloechinothrix halophila TaxID=1069073 RepID=UPI00041ECABB|nr:tautomerase family protein [Haloechinothrix halophila]